MPKNRILYNSQAVYIGPSPATGYHFIDDAGNLNNNYQYSLTNHNLIKKINRVTNFSYNITIPREEFKQLGKSKIGENIILNSPSVEINMEYYLNGITNEARMGWNVNHEYPEDIRSGELVYTNNFSNFIFSGLNTYDKINQPETSPFWPADNRSSKNIFLVVTYGQNEDEVTRRLATNQVFSRDSNVISFGDSYITSYETSCAVGETPKARVSFIADNIIYYTGSSGVGIPALNPKTRENYDEIKFVIPEEPVLNDLSIVLPSEINLDIQQTGENILLDTDNITGFGVQFRDIKIQSYNIGIRFEREDMNSIGYKTAFSRRINFPVPVTVSISAIVGDESTINLADMLKEDDRYNISLKMRNRKSNGLLLRYDFRKASLQNYDYSSSIEENRKLNLSFKVNATPDDLSEAFFISGLLSNIYTADLLVEESGVDVLTTENDDGIFLNLVPLY